MGVRLGEHGRRGGGDKVMKELFQMSGVLEYWYAPTASRTGASTRLPVGGRELKVAASEVP